MTFGVFAVLLGGIGIFLTGMVLLTDGLKASAGDALRSGLQRFARTPLRGVLSGASITALVQSSSATTLTTIGFVSAGLLTFPQSVGVIFGANLGTTSTGWIVSLLGLKISVGTIALPLVGVGALLRLLGRGRWSHAGTALVGFGLIFVGIDTLRIGMEGLAESIDPASFPGATIWGRVLLVGIGLGMTVVMQSSSAAVATTLTALHAGTLGLEQAGLLVVGQNMGTTVKAALASIGGSLPVRRTAAAHILFNLLTGALALALFPLLLGASVWMVGEGNPAVAVALFHSLFNLAGVVVLFPFISPFSRWVERMVPDAGRRLTGALDPSLRSIPSVAVEAARRSGVEIGRVLFRHAANDLEGAAGLTAAAESPSREPIGTGAGPRADTGRRDREDESIAEALAALRDFLTGIHTPEGERKLFERHLSILHATDHLERFHRALGKGGTADSEAAPPVIDALRAWRGRIEPGDGADAGIAELARRSKEVAEVRKERRERLFKGGVAGVLDAEAMRREVESVLRLDRLAYHAWRAAYHLDRAAPDQEGEVRDRDGDGDESLSASTAAATGDPNPRV